MRHGANAENGVLVLIRCLSTVTFRGHRILAKRTGKSVVPADDQNPHFQKLLTVCGKAFNELNFKAAPPCFTGDENKSSMDWI